MSKQITPMQLAHIVTSALTDQFDTLKQLESFMTDIANVVCNHFGGKVQSEALTMDDFTSIAIVGDESLPACGGIFAGYDREGSLWSGDDAKEESPAVYNSYVVTSGDTKLDQAILDSMLEVYFPDLIEKQFEDYNNCDEWQFVQKHASFQHVDVADQIIHVASLLNVKVPAALSETIQNARNNDITWVMFHLGQ